jgi:hypothetical protein
MDEDEPPDRRNAVLGLLAVVIIFAISWWVARELYLSGKMQDCMMSGRSNCTEIK